MLGFWEGTTLPALAHATIEEAFRRLQRRLRSGMRS